MARFVRATQHEQILRDVYSKTAGRQTEAVCVYDELKPDCEQEPNTGHRVPSGAEVKTINDMKANVRLLGTRFDHPSGV